MQRVLSICTGNICRSPVAAAMLFAGLGGRNSAFFVASAGIGAVVGHPATAEAAETAAARGLDLSAHRAQQLGAELAGDFELLLVMEELHRSWVTRHIPQARGRTFLLGHWRNVQIPDPFGHPLAYYEQICQLIETCAGDWISRLSA